MAGLMMVNIAQYSKDYGRPVGGAMRRIPAGEFQARCPKVIREVQATGEPVVITKRGEPVVQVAPVDSENDDICGFMAGQFKIVGDIESPVVPLDQWEVAKK
jgi:prevent-host-death family protein